MAYIYLHPADLQTFINKLKDYADLHSEQLQGVRSTNRSYDDPADVSRDISETSLMSSYTGDLDARAADLQKRLDEAVAMNQSGVTPMGDGGMVAYYLPDGGEYSQDTLENVIAFNSSATHGARQDAQALDQALSSADGRAADGRTVEQILAEQDKHKDVPAYAATYISTLGVDKYLDLPQRLEAYYSTATRTDDNNGYSPRYGTVTDQEAASRAAGVLGNMLAAASGSMVGYRTATSLAEAIDAAVSEKGHLGRVSGLNAMMGNTTGTVTYDTGFLVDLATRMEGRRYDGTHPARVLGNEDYGGACTGSTLDPMAGVLTAMGHNPEAAMTYLVPDGEVGPDGSWVPGSKAQERWELLSTRTWDPQNGYDGFTAAVGAASSLRVLDPEGPRDEKAAWITGQGIDYFADKAENAGVSYSPTAKNNIAIMLGNSLDDMEKITREFSSSASYDAAAYDSRRPALMAGDHSEAIRTLTGVAGTDDQALQTMTQAVGRHSALRTQAIIDAYPDVTLGQNGKFDRGVATGLRSDGQLLGFISQSAVDARTQAATRAVSSAQAEEDVSSVILGGLSAGLSAVPHPVTQVAGVGISLASPFIGGDVKKVDLSDVDAAQALVSGSQRSLEHSAIALLANNGRLDPGAYTDMNGADYATNHEWMSGDHTIDTASVLTNPEHAAQFENWLRDDDIPESDLKNHLEGGIGNGRRSASQ